MPSLQFFKKKDETKEESPETAAAPAETAAADAVATDAVAAAAPAAPARESTGAESEASGPSADKPATETKRGGFFSRKQRTSDANASESESEATSPTSRIPSFFARKKAAPAPVKEEDKENVPEPAAAPEPEVAAAVAPATEETALANKKEGDKVEEKVRRRISLFQRRNRADGAVSEGEVTDGDDKNKNKRTSFWKAATPKEEITEPAPEDPRLTEAKAKVAEHTEAENAAKLALENARKSLRDSKAALKNVESEIAAELRKKKAAKAEEAKPGDVAAPAAQTTVEPPVLPTVSAAA